MNVRLKFLGAAQTVTGSKYLLEIDDYKLLIDCGLFQGLKELRLKNWEDFPVDPSEIDAIVLTHAHIDHSGFLPRFVKEGFQGVVYCTSATEDLLDILLLDAAKLQEEEAEYAFIKGYSKHTRPQPLYDTDDVLNTLPKLKGFKYNEKIVLSERITINFRDAGHILGAAIVEVFLKGDSQKKKIVFSGDIGRYKMPILRSPAVVKSADILLVESTYGNRVNPPVSPKKAIADAVNKTFQHEGCLLIPAFAVGRTQMLIFYLYELINEKKIPNVPIFIDSPMGINVTGVYKRHQRFHKLNSGFLSRVLDFPNIHYYRSQQDSVAINDIKRNAIIVSSSGMCNGGRILHHLYNRLPRKNDTVLFVGYQALGTRGRKIIEREEQIRIFGQDVEVNCNVEHIEGLSAHADRNELLRWLSHFKKSPKYTFVVHGETESSYALADTLQQEQNWNTIVPGFLETYELFKGI